MVLMPFVISVSGLLLIQSHCVCTGVRQTTLFVPPESCETLHDEHQHLFSDHAEDLVVCCPDEYNHTHCNHNRHDHDCGCDSPEVKFLKLKNQFTDERVTTLKVIAPAADFSLNDTLSLNKETGSGTFNSLWLKYPPPTASSTEDYLYHICQLKIPVIA
jgi:hypothetical protein